MAVDPRGADLKRYLQEDPGVGGDAEPAAVRRGRPRAVCAVRAGVRHLPAAVRRGGALRGRRFDAAGGRLGQEWDAVLLVRYPSRAAFSRMVADPEYQEVTGLRTRALTEAVLQATVPW